MILSYSLVSFVLVLVNVFGVGCEGILYPQNSETREKFILDGIWNFRISPKEDPKRGFDGQWFEKPLEETGEVDLMPVPSSYNDITQRKEIRDHIGWAWYDTHFWFPKGAAHNNRILIRFGGVNYHAIVWINGIRVVEHEGGHLPFEEEIDPLTIDYQNPNRITVAINNTLSPDTVPQGSIVRPVGPRFPSGYFTLDYKFDFFNYAGIHRSVFVYTTPRTYISDITIVPSIDSRNGHIDYSITVANKDKYTKIKDGFGEAVKTRVSLIDKKGKIVAEAKGEDGKLTVVNPKLWWPFTMVANDSQAGYLYTFMVTVEDAKLEVVDVYRLKVGIRSVSWTQDSFLINGKPFYFRGFGRHEDFNIRGKGIDNVMIVKDHNLIKWMGANSYRTSHYPYAEEIMDLADQLGIVIIDECSAVSLDGFGPRLLKNHKKQMAEMIGRDKNRPSVVMWSVANEPRSDRVEAESYFKEIIDLTRGLDPSRPVTLVTAQNFNNDRTAPFVDILSINRYFSWYSDTGHTELIEKSMVLDVENWINRFKKPLLVTEYGADTIAGMHMSPDFVFTEEYQMEVMKEHFKAFDTLRNKTSFIGEMIWNFADFMTAQGITRIVGNRKGIFTRERQPKAGAHFLRLRYFLLASESEGYPFPNDLKDLIPVYFPVNYIHYQPRSQPTNLKP